MCHRIERPATTMSRMAGSDTLDRAVAGSAGGVTGGGTPEDGGGGAGGGGAGAPAYGGGDGGPGGGPGGGGAGGGGVAATAGNEKPQFLQNFAESGFSVPHAGQNIGTSHAADD